ncbi:MAG: sigma-70 family RNA polymerase sigma factor [Planctomycetota bacterium]
MASTDLALVRAALAGRRGARRKLARRLLCTRRLLATVAAGMHCRVDQDELEDLAQETMTRAWEKLAAFEGRASLETWLYRFCYLELMNFLRSRRRQPKPVADFGDVPFPEPVAPALPSSSGLDHLLRHLAPREAEVVRLRHVEQLEFREVGDVLGVSASTAKTSYYRGLGKLRALMGEAIVKERAS